MNEIKLNFFDRQKIKRKRQHTELKRQLQDTNILDRNIECDIITNDMKKQKEERELEVEKLKIDTQYYSTKIEISKLKNKNNVLNILADNTEKSAISDEKDGYKFCKSKLNLSLISSIITALTSISGIWCMELDTLAQLGATLFFIVLAILSNKLLNRLPKFLDKYLDIKSKISIFDLVISIICCSACTVMSLYTNLKFWNTFKLDSVSKYILSFIFDFFAISFTFVGYSLSNLRYKNSYLNSILSDNIGKEQLQTTNADNQSRQPKQTTNADRQSRQPKQTTNADRQCSQPMQVTNADRQCRQPMQVTNADKNTVRKSARKRVKSVEELQKTVDTLPNGTILKPSLFNMQGDKNYYNKIIKCRNVVKEGKKYIKRTNEKVVSISNMKKSQQVL